MSLRRYAQSYDTTWQLLAAAALATCLSVALGSPSLVQAQQEKVKSSFDTLVVLEGDWKLAPADRQEGGATKKGPASTLVGTDKTAMSFRLIGKGSTVQENLLPGTGKEMATMYHCNSFKDCTVLQAKHYCAKQNQPELILDSANSVGNVIAMQCDMETELCGSDESHVHAITHEISQDNSQLKTTYTIYEGGQFAKNSVYLFERKR